MGDVLDLAVGKYHSCLIIKNLNLRCCNLYIQSYLKWLLAKCLLSCN